MNNTYDYISKHAKTAKDYDKQSRNCGWFAHDLIFGLCYEYLSQGNHLLDIGIGTGLSSINFATNGVAVYGLEGSKAMLEICRAKQFTRELKLFDISNKPWPFTGSYFELVIACAILHFFPELEGFFGEVRRLIRKRGIFSFTTKCYMENKDQIETIKLGRIYSELSPEGLPVYLHTDKYVKYLLRDFGFEVLKMVKFLAPTTPGEGDQLFAAYVTLKSP